MRNVTRLAFLNNARADDACIAQNEGAPSTIPHLSTSSARKGRTTFATNTVSLYIFYVIDIFHHNGYR